MSAHNLLVAGLALLVPAMAKPATAAQIDVVPPTANFPGMILVRGELVLEDIDQFRTKASAANNTAIVLLDSPGGSLLAGIRIGKFIRMKSWATAIGLARRRSSRAPQALGRPSWACISSTPARPVTSQASS